MGKKGDGGTSAKLVTTVATVGGVFVLRKVLATVWTKITGKEPPTDLAKPEVTLPEVLLWAVATGASFAADASVSYLLSFLYLAVAASCVTFMLYFELVRRLGPGRAAYTLAVVPLVALVLSALFEHLTLGWPVLAGASAILLGNVLVLSR